MRVDFRMAPEEPKLSWKDGWINTQWHIHVMEYCSVLKEKEVLTHTVT